MDLVLDCTDDWETRFAINDVCLAERRDWVFAGVVESAGQVLAVRPGRSMCLRCLMEEAPPAEASPKCAQVGVIGPAVALIAAWQASMAMQRLAGLAPPPRLIQLDLWAGTVRTLDAATRRAGCLCSARDAPR